MTEDYYSQAIHGPYEVFDIGDLPLELGGALRPCRLAYSTYGALNAAKDNAILVLAWFAGTHKVMEQVYIGPGRALDPDKYFIVAVNQIGSGLSSSPHNTEFPLGAAHFPQVTIGDDVVAQERFLRQRFGIEGLALVVGGSMGAQQVYEWAIRFPDKVRRAAPIAGTARTTPHDGLFVSALADAISEDPAWSGGWYRDPRAVIAGLRRHARLWTLMGLSAPWLRKEGWRPLGFGSLDDFQLNFFEKTFLPMDPNNLLSMAWKWRTADVARHSDGDLAAALARIQAKTMVMPISSDMIFTVQDCAAEQTLIPNSELRVLDTAWGHAGLFGLDQDYIRQVDTALLSLLATPVS